MSMNFGCLLLSWVVFLLSKIMWQMLLVSPPDSPYQDNVPLFQFLWLVVFFSRGWPPHQEMPGKLCCPSPPQVSEGQWQTQVGLQQLSLLASEQGNIFVGSIHLNYLWDQSEANILLKSWLCFASSPALSCFPCFLTGFSWKHPTVSHLYKSSCLRLCFLGTQPKTTCKIFVNRDHKLYTWYYKQYNAMFLNPQLFTNKIRCIILSYVYITYTTMYLIIVLNNFHTNCFKKERQKIKLISWSKWLSR